MAGGSSNLTFRLLGVDVSASRALETLGTNAGRLVDKIKDIGPELAGIAGVAGIGATISKGISENLDISQATGKLQAQLGITAQKAGEYAKVAGQVYADNWGESITAVMDDFAAAGQQIDGFNKMSATSQKGLMENIQAASSTTGMEAKETIRGISQLINTGLVKNATEATDVLVKMYQSGADRDGDILDTFNEYSTQFKNLGLNASTAGAMMAAAVQHGARSSDNAADTIKEAYLRISQGGKPVQQSLKAIGLDYKTTMSDIAAGGPKAAATLQRVFRAISETKNGVARSTAITNLLGGPGEDLGQPAIAAMGRVKGGLKDLSGAAAKAGTALSDNLNAKLQTFKRTVETNIIRVTAPAAAGLTALFDGVTGQVSAMDQKSMPQLALFGQGLRGLFDAARTGKAAGSGLVGQFAAIGAKVHAVVVPAFNAAVTIIKTRVIPFLRDVATFIRTGVIPAARNLAEAVLPVLKDAWNGLRGAVGVLLPALSAVGHFLADTLGPALVSVTGFVKDHKTAITALAVGIGSAIVAMKAYKAIVTTVKIVQQAAALATYGEATALKGLTLVQKVAVLWTQRQIILSKAMAAAQAALNLVMDANPLMLVVGAIVALAAGFVYAWKHSETFRDTVKAVLGAVTHALKAVWNFVKKWAVDLGLFLLGPVGMFISLWRHSETFRDIVRKVLSAVVSAAKAFAHGVATAFTTVVGWVKDLISAWWSLETRLFGILKDIVSKLLGWAGDVWGAIKTAISYVGKFISAVADIPGKVFDWFSKVPGMILSALGDLGSLLIDAGKKLIQGFVDGIKGMWNSVKNTLGDLTDALTSWKGPPERDAVLLYESGRLVIQSFINGLESKYGAVRSSLLTFTKDLPAGIGQSDIAGAMWRANSSDVTKGVKALKDANTALGKAARTDRTDRSAYAHLDRLADHAETTAKRSAAAAAKAKKAYDAADKSHKAAAKSAMERADKLAAADKKAADAARKRSDDAKSRAADADSALKDAKSAAADAKAALADSVYAAAQDKAAAFVDEVKAQLQRLSEAAAQLRSDFASSVQNGTSMSELFANGGGTGAAIASLQNRLAAAKQFRDELAQLQSEGLNGTLISQVAAAGPDAGRQMAEQLLAGGKGAIDQFNSLTDQLSDVASTGMDQVATNLYGAGANALNSLVQGLRQQFPQLASALDEVSDMVGGVIGTGKIAAPAVTTHAAAAATKAAVHTASKAPRGGTIHHHEETHVHVHGIVAGTERELGRHVVKVIKAHQAATGGKKVL